LCFSWIVELLDYLVEVYDLWSWIWNCVLIMNDDIWYMWWMKNGLVERVFILMNGFDEVDGFKIYIKWWYIKVLYVMIAEYDGKCTGKQVETC